MKVILSTFNKGGVGKTTLAVHIAGVFAKDPYARVLLIDCVDQYDSYKYFTNSIPESELTPVQSRLKNVSVLWNPDRSNAKKLISSEEYDCVVLDLNSPSTDTVKAIIDMYPTQVLLPINRQALAIERVDDTLAIIAVMEDKAGYTIPVTIVPLGEDLEVIKNQIDHSPEKPRELYISGPIHTHEKEFADALRSGKFIWDYPGCEYIQNILSDVLR